MWLRLGRILVALLFLAIFPVTAAFAQNTYYLPHVADGKYAGGSFRTTFILFDNSSTDTTVLLELTDSGGTPLVVTIPGLGTGSQFTIQLAAGATRILQTDGAGNLATGAAKVTSLVKIGVSSIFTLYDPAGNYLSEAGVGNSVPLTEFVLPVDTTEAFNTGLALFNAGAVEASITLSLRDTNGIEAARFQFTLAAGKHIARFVKGASEFFPAIGSFQGTLLVQCTAPVSVLVLRQHDSPLSYTSLPAVATSSTATTLNLAHWASGVFNGGSFRTSFLIFNISSSAANVTITLTASATIPGRGTGTVFNLPPLAPGASLFLQTDGAGNLATGGAAITSNVPIGASGIFTVFNLSGAFTTEAGVGDSAAFTTLTLPVQIVDGLDTGIAFFRPGGTGANLTFRLLDQDGYLMGTSAPQALAGNGHWAVFISQVFPGTSGFHGSVAITATAGVSAMTLRQSAAPLSYTTLPIETGTAPGKAPVAPLLSRTATDIDALANNPNVVLNQVLPAGFKLSGRISGPGMPVLVSASAGGTSVYTGTVDVLTGRYLIVLPAGTYALKVCYQPAGAASAVIATYDDPAAVSVAGDTTHDASLPAVSLLQVSGAVSGLNNLPAGTATTIHFVSADRTAQGVFNLDAGGSYQGVLPAGTYVVSVGRQPIQFLPLQSESLQLYNLGSLTVPGGAPPYNYAVPATVTLSGTITLVGFATLPTGSSLMATDASATLGTQLTCCTLPATSSASPNLAGQYQMVLAQGRTFGVSTLIPFALQGNLFGTISYPAAPDSLILNVNTDYSILIPRLTRTANIFGQVTDSQGRPVANVTVIARGSAIQDAPNMGFAAADVTDAFGNYSIIVLSGTSYQVSFVPLQPTR